MAKNDSIRVVMFPWLAFGHMIPYLEFGKLIAEKGHHVFFVSTPRNIDRLPKINPHLLPFFTFVKMPLPPIENLPPDAEAAADLPINMVKYLVKSYNELRKTMTEFLESSDPDWILHDFTSYWLCPIASQLGIKIGFFSIFNPAFLGFTGPVSAIEGYGHRKKIEDFTVPPNWVPFPTTVAYSYFHIKKLLEVLMEHKSDGNASINSLAKVIENSDVIAVRGSYEFEPEWFRVLDNIYQKPVFPVGHFPATEFDGGEETETWRFIRDWLDKQDRASVVYVAFGSEAKPTKSELEAVALGLEQSELPFFWALRTRRGSADTEVTQLPEGFEERTRGRGLVFTSWIPQLKILAHDSVGGFLCHAGWSSVLEAIQFEKGLILLTFFGDQGINIKFLADKKLGYPIPRDEHDGSFTSDSVAESLRLVMVDEEGKIYRDKIREVRPLVIDKNNQDKYVVNFLDYLKRHRNRKKSNEVLESY